MPRTTKGKARNFEGAGNKLMVCSVCQEPISIEEASSIGYVQAFTSYRHVGCEPVKEGNSIGKVIKYIAPEIVEAKNNDPVLTAGQVERLYHVGHNTVIRAIERGKFPATGIKTGWLIDTRHEAFQSWIEDVKERAVKYNRVEVLAKARAARAIKVAERKASNG